MIQKYAQVVKDTQGTLYDALVHGKERADGTWEGWIEFHALDGSGRVVRTDRETSQPNRITLVYWASGLESIYFEGALERASQQVRT